MTRKRLLAVGSWVYVVVMFVVAMAIFMSTAIR